MRFRVKFFSKEDYIVPDQLKKSEKILDSFIPDQELSLTDLFEFYSVKLYFDNDLFLISWSEEVKKKYQNIVNSTYEILKKAMLSLQDKTILQELTNLDQIFFDNFWELFNHLSVYKQISNELIGGILKVDSRQIYQILKHKKIIDKYDQLLRSFLMDYDGTAELMLSKFEKKEREKGEAGLIVFPKSLSPEDREHIICQYIEREEPNINFLNLIVNSTDSTDLKLSSKTRFSARKKLDEQTSRIFEKGSTFSFGCHVFFREHQKEPSITISQNRSLYLFYSEDFIKKFPNNADLFQLFKSFFFNYTDNENLVTFVSKPSELSVIERISIQSKNEYKEGVAFRFKENLAHSQLLAFNSYLKRKGNNIESVINSYVEIINHLIQPHHILFRISENPQNYLQAIRTILPDFELLLKQIKILGEEGCIDLELIRENSKPIKLGDIPSSKNRKYIYLDKDNYLLSLQYHFFSDQCPLFIIGSVENKYDNFYNLLLYENIRLEQFKNYQKPTVQYLLENHYLKIDEQGFLKLDNEILLYLVGQIHCNGVISYWSYCKEIRDVIDALIDEGLLNYENTLFSRQEKSYINFYLNKKEFTNGLDLRNKYLHGTNSFSEDQNAEDYFRLLKIIVVTLLKIEDDLTNYDEPQLLHNYDS